MRVYLPVVREELAGIAAGTWQCPDRPGVLASSEDEEAEYDALHEAAEQSELLPGAAGSRAVLVIDGLAPASVQGGSAVISGRISLARVVALHLAEPGEDDLSWYASQEIASLG